MDIKKLLMGGIAGGVTCFLLGWLIFGMLLMNFMNNHTGAAGNISRAEADMQYLYLIIGNLSMGFLLAYVFIKSNVSTLAGGLIYGAVFGLLVTVAFDCIWYATTTAVSKTAMAADVAGSTVMLAVAGAVVGMVLGMGKKAA